MMMEIVTGADTKILRTVCKPVEKFDKDLVKLVAEMEETMLHEDPETGLIGVGIAANQVGIDQRVFLITLNVGTKKAGKTLAMINPGIIALSDEKITMEEGCLSLPKTFGTVSRPQKVVMKWQNVAGNWCEKKFDGWDARIILHEYDHLQGIMFTDYK